MAVLRTSFGPVNFTTEHERSPNATIHTRGRVGMPPMSPSVARVDARVNANVTSVTGQPKRVGAGATPEASSQSRSPMSPVTAQGQAHTAANATPSHANKPTSTGAGANSADSRPGLTRCTSAGVLGVGGVSICESEIGRSYSARKDLNPLISVGPSVTINNKGQLERVCITASPSITERPVAGIGATGNVRMCITRSGELTAGASVSVSVGSVPVGGVPGAGMSYSNQAGRDVTLISLKDLLQPSGPPSRTYFDHPSYWRR
jgi:hypothetical protein